MDFGVFKINECMLVKEIEINVDYISKKIMTAQNIKFNHDSLICDKDWVNNVLVPRIEDDFDFRYLKQYIKNTLINIFTSDIVEKYAIFTFYTYPDDSEIRNYIKIVGDNYQLNITYSKKTSICVFDIELGGITFNVKIQINKGKCEANDIVFLRFDPDDFRFMSHEL